MLHKSTEHHILIGFCRQLTN